MQLRNVVTARPLPADAFHLAERLGLPVKGGFEPTINEIDGAFDPPIFDLVLD
jgi:hypothetical protein